MCTQIVGILNITRDSFSDGGRYLDPTAAIDHALALVDQGADAVDVGPASSHPDAETVSPTEEIRRLEPVLEALRQREVPFSVDSYHPETQRFAARAGARWLNDIHGFSDPALYPELAALDVGLVVMHAVQQRGSATRVRTEARAVLDGVFAFFEARVAALVAAGVARERLILDPGMGFFLGSTPEPSFRVLAAIGRLREHFDLPIYISVSRKSFLRAATKRPVGQIQAATLAAELLAVERGATFVRTHEPGPLCDALTVLENLERAG